MIRRLLLAPLAVAVVATGCSTFDSNVVARVDDAELTTDQLGDLIDALPSDDPEGSAQLARNRISLWILVETLRGAYERDGIEVTDDDRAVAAERLRDPAGIPGFDELDADMQDELADWQATFDALGDDVAYRQQAIASAEIWVKPRYGQPTPDGAVAPLALPTTPAAG